MYQGGEKKRAMSESDYFPRGNIAQLSIAITRLTKSIVPTTSPTFTVILSTFALEKKSPIQQTRAGVRSSREQRRAARDEANYPSSASADPEDWSDMTKYEQKERFY